EEGNFDDAVTIQQEKWGYQVYIPTVLDNFSVNVAEDGSVNVGLCKFFEFPWAYDIEEDWYAMGHVKVCDLLFLRVTIAGIAMGMIEHAACSSVGQGIASVSGSSPRCIHFVYLDTISAFYAEYVVRSDLEQGRSYGRLQTRAKHTENAKSIGFVTQGE
ncbi:hypothetical protein Tco_0859094, partial [Tanacetum coccineum]